MKKLSKKTVLTSRGLMVIMVSVLGTVTLASCTINYSKLADGIGDIGRGVDHMVNGTSEVSSESSSTEPTVSEETSASEETKATDAAPTPTPIPTPSPTPVPERVDFSKLIEDKISDDVEVKEEEFGESFHAEGDDTELVTFTGNRMVVSIPKAENIQTAINLILDGFYGEASGLYDRYSKDATAAYSLDKDTYLAAPYAVTVNYAYSYNGRLLTMVMEYNVTNGSETPVDSKKEIATFDVLTGQYVTPATIAIDELALEEALTQTIIQVASTEELTYTKDMIKDPIIIAHQQSGGTSFAEIYWSTNGVMHSIPADLANYAEYFNTYGKIAYKVG